MSRKTNPKNSKTRVNKAGRNIRLEQATNIDQDVLENWRASHNHILNTWQAILRGRIKDKEIILAQRLKRKKTIYDKLLREPEMSLARMHDIAGCRLIFKNIGELNTFRKSLHHKPRFKHILKKSYNYIEDPKYDGYRGIHDIYEYRASRAGGKKWNGLLVEIQYRTIQQHAWATAVEVAGHITGSHTKFDKGNVQQKKFFKLTSEIIARSEENLKSCYPNMNRLVLIGQYLELEKKLKLTRDMVSAKVLNQTFTTNWENTILIFDETEEGQSVIDIRSYKTFPKATEALFALEKESGDNKDIVLVRAESAESIRAAFKNYFSDTKDFVALVNDGCEKLLASK